MEQHQQLEHKSPLATHLPDHLSEFIAAEYPPQDHQPVIAIRVSGYNCCQFEIITARYMPEHRPTDPWRMIDGESVRASGGAVLGWKQCHRWLCPK